ncbi:MAG: hypothetical protein ACFFE5_09150 [Candidatus Thorarchaeota archaeon]
MQNNNNIKETVKNVIKKKVKEELKQEIKQELLDEIYKELLEESQQNRELNRIPLKNTVKINKPSTNTKNVNKDVQDTPKEVLISVKAFLKIATHALKYANSKIPKNKWVEVIGYLAGKEDKTNKILHIEDAYPLGHGNAVFVETKHPRNQLSGSERAYHEIKKNKQFVCGWYHSHPSYGYFMSPEDLHGHSQYTKWYPEAVALVIDPFLINGTEPGFEIYRVEENTKQWYPLIYGIKGSLDVRMLPELLEFIYPIIDGKAVYLEYDEI